MLVGPHPHSRDSTRFARSPQPQALLIEQPGQIHLIAARRILPVARTANCELRTAIQFTPPIIFLTGGVSANMTKAATRPNAVTAPNNVGSANDS